MSKRFRPALLIGLGNHGAKLARLIHEGMLANIPDVQPALACLTLADDGHDVVV